MAGLLEAVQMMVGGKADKEEVQGLRRLLGDKVNLADHQVPLHRSQRMYSLMWIAPGTAPIPAGLLRTVLLLEYLVCLSGGCNTRIQHAVLLPTHLFVFCWFQASVFVYSATQGGGL